MRYEAYRYLWPPRPEIAAPPALIRFYEQRGWRAQVKKNGTCTVIFARGREVIFKTRHNDDHKAWTPQASHVAFFAGRPAWNVYVAELLHSKGPSLKNHLYLFDVLVSDGEQLIGRTFEERQALLAERFPSPVTDHRSWAKGRAGLGSRFITDDVSLAELVEQPVQKAWDSLGELDEGLVFKKPDAVLTPCVSERNGNTTWQVKIRRPHSNYSF